MTISRKIEKFVGETTWIRKIFEEGVELKKRVGEDRVYDFSLGNPILDPPEEFYEQLRSLVLHPRKGMHRYMQNAGYPEVRRAIAEVLAAETGVMVTQENVVMTCGAGGGINIVLKAILDEGDEVIIISPYFVEYLYYIDNWGARAVIVPAGKDFNLDVSGISESISPSTKAILINSPNNPTGVVYPEETLRELVKAIEEAKRRYGRDIYLVSDEPYRRIIYDNVKCPWIFPIYRDSMIVTSSSKDLGLSGERIGYAAVHPGCKDGDRIIAGMIFNMRALGYVNAPALMQNILRSIGRATVNVDEYRRKRDLLCEGLGDAGYEFVKPQGAFYLFSKSPIDDDVAFVRELQKENILTVPGSGFGTPHYFRIAYCVEDETIVKAIPGFKKVFRSIK
ncbi:MAG: pyridoxal phosphate-dependent aminotransferase [Acidobacteriota bacterium]